MLGMQSGLYFSTDQLTSSDRENHNKEMKEEERQNMMEGEIKQKADK